MDNTSSEILEIKRQIDNIREYLESDLCKKCEEMNYRLLQCEQLLKKLEK